MRGWLRVVVVVWNGGLGPVSPSDLFGRPILIVVFNVGPIVLALGSVLLLKARRNMNSIFLEFIVCKLAWFWDGRGCSRKEIRSTYFAFGLVGLYNFKPSCCGERTLTSVFIPDCIWIWSSY